MKREDFKVIIKECIKELIKEGAFNNILASTKNLKESSASITQAKLMKEEMQVGLKYQKEMASSLAKVVGKDLKQQKMFESIFEDTAKNTLQEKLIAEARANGEAVLPTEQEMKKDEADLNKLGGVNKWATIYNASSKRKSSLLK